MTFKDHLFPLAAVLQSQTCALTHFFCKQVQFTQTGCFHTYQNKIDVHNNSYQNYKISEVIWILFKKI